MKIPKKSMFFPGMLNKNCRFGAQVRECYKGFADLDAGIASLFFFVGSGKGDPPEI